MMAENEQIVIAEPMQTHFEMIPIHLIDDPVMAMRSDMNREGLDELVLSIRAVGIIEPIVVKPVGDRYEVIAGHRRITAAEPAGLTEVPCHVIIATEEQVEMMKIHENLMRVDVNPLDEASHYKRLMDNMKLSPARIARLTNRGENYVRARLNILNYPSDLQHALADGRIKLGVAQELFRIKDEMKLREMMNYAIGSGVTTAVAKKWVDESLPQPEQKQTFTPMTGDQGNIVPASEQHTNCFYCMQAVRLLEAYVVYVHEDCMKQREADAEATDDPQQQELPQ